MPLHHYLPATFLANFSLESGKLPRRDRAIFVGDKKSKDIFEVTAGNAGAINNLYTLLDYKKDPETIDKIWADYEAMLHRTIPRLIVGYDLDAKTWLRLLVPFVACMLVRGPDFNIRFENRIKALLGEKYSEKFINKDNTNTARTLELQRLLFPVAAAKWIVVYSQGSEPILTNDLGYCPFFHPKTIDYGLAIPLNLNHVLAISPRKKGEILRFSGGKWRPIIHYRIDQFGNHEDLNRSIVSMAQRFVFSPTKELLNKYLPQYPHRPRPIEPEQLGFIDGHHSRAYELTWHRLAIFLEENEFQKEGNDEFLLNWQHIFSGWNSPVIMPINLSGFPVPLSRGKQSISFHCYDPDDYYTLNIVMNCESSKVYDEMLNNANLGFQNTSNEEMKLEFLFAISVALYELGYVKDSYKIINEILIRNPSHHNARLNLAANLLEERNLDDALFNLNYILEKDPSSIMARINLCNYYVLKEDYSKAIEEATKACMQSPKGHLLGCAQLSRGLAFLHDKQLDKAFNDFSSARNNIKDKEKLGICNYYKAITSSQMLKEEKLEINSQMNTQNGKKDSREYIITPTKDFSMNDIIHDLSVSIDLLPNDSEAYLTALDIRGDLYQQQGRVNLALDDYLEAEHLNPLNPKYPFNQGNVLIEIGDFPRSINANNRVLELSPDNGGAYNNRGIAKLLSGRYSQARFDFLQAIKLFGNSPEAGSPYRHLTHVSLLEDNYEEAREHLQKSFKLDPQSPYNHILEGMVEFYNENSEKALEIFIKIHTKFNSVHDFHLYQIFPLISLRRVGEALEIIKKNIKYVTKFSLRIIYHHMNKMQKTMPKNETYKEIYKLVEDLINN